jgi:ankyrin repeat protein
MRLLPEHGTDVHARDTHNRAALHVASAGGKVDVVHLLLQHNADVNAQDKSFFTPLCRALTTRPDVVRFLRTQAADVNIRGPSMIPCARPGSWWDWMDDN